MDRLDPDSDSDSDSDCDSVTDSAARTPLAGEAGRWTPGRRHAFRPLEADRHFEAEARSDLRQGLEARILIRVFDFAICFWRTPPRSPDSFVRARPRFARNDG